MRIGSKNYYEATLSTLNLRRKAMYYIQVNDTILPTPYRFYRDALADVDRIKEMYGPCCITIISRED